MSRTYRYRHGFSNRRGLKYTEARLYHRENTLEAEYLREYAHDILGLPCLIGGTRRTSGGRQVYVDKHSECIYHVGGYSMDWWRYVRHQTYMREDTINHWMNPHIGYGAQFSGKNKYYRTEGNRRGRHHDKQKLHMLQSHGTKALRCAYDIYLDYCGDDKCPDCGTYFLTDPYAAIDLEQELSRKHSNWDRWALT